jgi:hypothetical protein
VNEGAKGFEVSALITSASDRAGGRKDIEANAMAREMSAKMFEFVVPIAFTEGFQGKTYMLDDLVERCHVDYYKNADGEARTAAAVFFRRGDGSAGQEPITFLDETGKNGILSSSDEPVLDATNEFAPSHSKIAMEAKRDPERSCARARRPSHGGGNRKA